MRVVRRRAKNDEIKDQKQKKQAEREKEKAEAEKKEAEAKASKEKLDEKRAANIKDKEQSRNAKGQKSKYAKKEILELKLVFDEYDKDRSGKVSLEEFTKRLKDKKSSAGPRPGEKSTLQERNATKGIGLEDLSEGAFREMDRDGDGEVEFKELLKLMYRLATDNEIAIMLEWVAPEPEPEPEPKAELSNEAKKQIKGIFKLYDKDKSGFLTFKELKVALEKTGIDQDDIKQYFKEFDQDGNEEISSDEFMKLMESTGAFDES